MPIFTPRYSKGEIVRVSTENYIKDKIPKGSPGEIIHVNNHTRTFTYSVEVVTEEDGYPRVQRTFREDELEPIPNEPSTGIKIERKGETISMETAEVRKSSYTTSSLWEKSTVCP